ncbi:MAG: HAD-IB family phosphatase [Propioniciclava sp.]|uniref:HAD-IB family phosphatase n=1 Tax=Propioniciclava sp. TaxID=2038686 RepID=UPI0039E67305
MPQPTRVLLTGVTGFLGQAVLERLLSSTDAHVTAIIRPKGSQSARKRLDRLMRKPVFKTWRDAVGDAEAKRVFAERTDVLEADLSTLEHLEGPVDVVIHSASTVSFDAPIDECFANNVGGPEALYGALARSGLDPHVIHVSTCYVGGIAKGLRPEASVDHDVDWRAELAAARVARAEAEAESRTPERLQSFIDAATRDHGKQGPKSVAKASEQARKAWIVDRMVELGRTRARSVGWTDVYTFSKALGERVAEQEWAGQGHRLSIVRPAIIESALRYPYPGWIDGFKVADPLIMAYAKGALPEFPGLPDSVLDVIPVDYVVNVILALARLGHQGPEASDAGYYQVCSGASNPLPFHRMYGEVREYFLAHPLEDDKGRPIVVPTWKFPANNAAERSLRLKERLSSLGSRIGASLPATKATREWASSLSRMERGLGSLRTYVDLYQSYTRTEMLFDDQQTRALGAQLPAGTPADQTFDVRDIEWGHYWQSVHLPAMTSLAKVHARASSAKKASRSQARRLESGTDVLAVFDLEGTLVASSLVTQYLSVMGQLRALAQLPGEMADLVGKAGVYLQAERRDRGEFVRAFSRRYAGTKVADIERVVAGDWGQNLVRSIRPGALARIEEHRAAGHRTVLVTGSLDLFAAPLVPLFDEVVASRMEVRDGVLTGYLATPPLVDEARAQWLKDYAVRHGIDLSRSHGYGDSIADASWLQLLGRPVAVNPDLPLYRAASRLYWPIEDWKRG